MPTILRSGPYRFFFYSGDRNEPPHIHVEHGGSEAKFWLDPVRLEHSRGFADKELNRIQGIIQDHQTTLLGSWHEFFGN